MERRIGSVVVITLKISSILLCCISVCCSEPPPSKTLQCHPHQFLCKDRLRCIDKTLVCDLNRDCYDGSDEFDCPHVPCRKGTFKCKHTDRCIPEGWLCDGTSDCGIVPGTLEQDSSDEDLFICKEKSLCPKNQYQCYNSQMCIEILQICDGVPDCTNQDDEHLNCNNKTICDSSFCKYGCKPSIGGNAICFCPPGQIHNGDICVGSPPQNGQGCDHDVSCKTEEDKMKNCSCCVGYVNVGSGCKAIDAPKGPKGSPIIIFQEEYRVILTDLNGNKIKGYEDYGTPDNTGISGIDFDHLNETVFWIYHANHSHTLQFAAISNLSEVWNKRTSNLYLLEDVFVLAFDWINTNFYFVNDYYDIVFVCREDFELCKTVIESDISKPRGLALDPTRGFIFITVWGKSGAKIERTLMNGDDRTIVVSQSIVYPQAITLDYATKRVYWTDHFLDSVDSVDYDGKKRLSIIRGVQLRDIVVFEDNLYYLTYHENSVYKTEKWRSNLNTTVIKGLNNPFAIKIYHRVRQPRLPRERHPCKVQGHHICSDFCFTNVLGQVPAAVCSCREGYVLGSDGKSCSSIQNQTFIVYTKSSNRIIRSSIVTTGFSLTPQAMVPVLSKGEVYSSFAYDMKSQVLFYSDATNFRIMSKRFNETTAKVYLDKNVGFVGSMRIDSIAKTLFWIDESIPAIYAGALQSSATLKLLVHRNLTSPRDICLDSRNGIMFWSSWTENNSKGKIEVAWMDGSRRFLFVNGLVKPLGLTLDSINNYIYWVDAATFIVQRCKITNALSSACKPQTILNANTTYYGEPTDATFWNGFLLIAVQGSILKVEVPIQGLDKLRAGKQLSSVFLRNEDIIKFRIYTSNLPEDNNCSIAQCEALCLPKPVSPGFTCACPEGYSLNPDNKTCSMNIQYLNPLNCSESQFMCKKFPKCIALRSVCDGVEDCEDGSDESNICETSIYQKGLCGRNSFYCGDLNGTCINIQDVCNGIQDCPNGNDEIMSNCRNNTSTCTSNEFECRMSHRCIPHSWVCDGERDCGDEEDTSDEHETCVYKECTRLQYQCPGLNSTVCIPLESICDGIQDCPGDGSDELECPVNCSEDQVYCKYDNKCILKEQRCDGFCDCQDGWDEINCSEVPSCAYYGRNFVCDFGLALSPEECYNVSCGSHSFKCNDGTQCVPLWARCDRKSDCRNDGSDELGCNDHSITCEFPSLSCDNGTKCLPVTSICNGHLDCGDQQDELYCQPNICQNSSCLHNCVPVSNTQYKCYCPEGLFKDPDDESSCIEQHPCDRFGTCSQLCWRIGGTQYQCLCRAGFVLKDDNTTCTHISDEEPYLVFSNRHELRGLYLNNASTSFQSLISNLRNSIALDFFYQEGRYDIFWSDVVDDRIYRGSLVGGSLINIQIVIETGLSTAEGLAVDWIGENIYWVESNLDQIEVAKLNGSYRKTLISGNMVSPRSIAVDPNIGFLFWSDWQTEDPRIETATMSGKLRSIIYKVGSNGEGAWPNGLTLDYELQRLYWVDARLDSIHTIKYDGSDYQTVLSHHDALSHPFSITMFESVIVWTDWRSNSVMKANKFNGSKVTVLHKTYTQPFDVKILHSSRQPLRISNPCGQNNGNCSHLCLLSVNGSHDCGCPHLKTLSSDGRNCNENEKMIIFSRLNEIRAVYYDNPNYHAAPPISYPLIVMPANLHFVSKHKQIYWSDSQSGETKRANVSKPMVETLIDSAAGKPLAIGVDWISNLIFIALQSAQSNSISVTNLDGQYFTTIIQGKTDLKFVNSIAVNPYKPQIFWPDGSNSNDFRIQKSYMDGSKRKILTSTADNPLLLHPASLSYDFYGHRLYWVNMHTTNVQYYDFQINQVKTISFGNFKPYVITVHGAYVFFAAEKHQAIIRGNKNTGRKYDYVRNNTENIYSIKIYDPDDQKGRNPCSENKGGCPHLCLPLSSQKKTCKCALGYVPGGKYKNSCETVDTILIYSDSHGIKGVNPKADDYDDYLVPIPLVSFATDIDVIEKTERIYWLDHEKNKISSINRDGTDRKSVLYDIEATGLAIDWVAGNMYWANPKDSFIEVAHIDGSSHYVLITEYLDKPVALAVDPSVGLLFWTDVKGQGHIARATLDGKSRQIIALNEHASDIAVDLKKQVLYWCDSTNGKINSVLYDGSEKKIIFSGTSDSHINSLIVNRDNLYWIDIETSGGSIMTSTIGNSSSATALKKNLGVSIKDISIFSKGRQSGTNPCGNDNGGCSDLCFWNGTNVNCVCAHGMLSTEDHKSCRPFEAFIAFSRVSSIETVHVTPEVTPNYPHPPIKSPQHIRNAIGLAYDYSRELLFYSDVQLGTINSVSFNGTDFKIVAEKQGSVEGLYFEAVNSELYWTCSNDASINRMNPYKTQKVEKLITMSLHDKPRGIAVDSCQSRIYWTNWDSNRPSIQRSYLSGYKIQSIITKDIRMPNSLALDHRARKLYWVDARLDKIERCNLDGTGRVIIVRDNPKHAFSLAVFEEYLIWSDWVRLAIVRANKYTGKDLQILRKNIPKPMGVVAVFSQKNICGNNPCLISNGGCEEKCTVDEFAKAHCECFPGKVLRSGRCLDRTLTMNCSSDKFECSNGECILYQLSCDGIPNCSDKSDEEETYCGIRRCKEGFLKCSTTNRCIPRSSLCDSTIDCPGDGFDEQNCTCKDDQFQCYDGRCIRLSKKCDQHPDCLDYSDELKSECPNVSCLKGDSLSYGMEFHSCPNTTACISPKWECDGQNDCFDNSDEQNCSFEVPVVNTTSCQPTSFRCNDGQCILSAWHCDGDGDCDGWEDEQGCSSMKCSSAEFDCGRECIVKSARCDGISDCSNGLDEKDCNCDLTRQYKCSDGQCIPLYMVCDGEPHCPDGMDENPAEGCLYFARNRTETCFNKNEFQCQNGFCIPMSYRCDSETDCADGEDEFGCTQASCEKSDPRNYHCPDGKCIHYTRKCDGVKDCVDGSDEDKRRCYDLLDTCHEEHFFKCRNDICIKLENVCNGENDCGDFSDESGCGVNECEFSEKVCDQICEDKDIGFKCTCFPGYEINHDNKNECVDRDECTERLCSQLCKNSIGSFKCSCLDGYVLHNNTVCKANSSFQPQVIFTNQYYIRMVSTNPTKQMRMVTQNLTNAVALDYHWDTGCVYWSDVTTVASSIKRLCTNSNDSRSLGTEQQMTPKTLHHWTLSSPDGLAVDWIGDNLYWCDKGTNSIEVSKLNGMYRKVLIKGLQDPRAIALDPFRGYLYWSDWGDEPVIGKAGMDGTRQQTLISDNLAWPNALTISFETNEIWWADAKEDYIAVANLHGKNRRIVHSRSKTPGANIHHIFSLTVFENWVYWSDWETRTIERCHKYTGENQSSLTNKLLHRPMDVKVFHPFRQPPMQNNPCDNNGGCDKLCLLKPDGGRVCECPENFIVTDDGLGCRSNCTSSHFVCTNTSKCILKWWKCDTQEDCEDGEDEPPDCPPFKCTPGQVPFGDTCLYPTALCDGNKDAPNGEDELNCDDHTCFTTQFKCHGNGTIPSKCIPSQQRCDGNKDCVLGQDEEGCGSAQCPPNQHRCSTTHKCLQQEWVCDKDDDCGDGSDESNCESRTCEANYFRCNSGKCIPNSWKCDGEKDCFENEDEDHANCTIPITCEPTYYRCLNSHKCIPGRWKCDDDLDCPEQDDENNCTRRECSESEFRCGDGRCIHSKFHCDGEYQCLDQSDEFNCHASCNSNETMCRDSQACFPAHFRCDGEIDCVDGSDEDGCNTTICEVSHGFVCNSSNECINSNWVCDGEKDCPLGDDENEKMCSERPCGPGRFRCRNNVCIPFSATCNFVDDCTDGSDELPGMCLSHKLSCSPDEFECDGSKCFNISMVCDGFNNCIDGSDEQGCELCRFGTCSQQCVFKKRSDHSDGQFSCECVEGYVTQRVGNKTTCTAMGQTPLLGLATENSIRLLSKPMDDTDDFSKVSVYKVDSIDFIFDDNGKVQLFWISKLNKTIVTTTFISSDFQPSKKRQKRYAISEVTELITGLSEPRALAVDWISRILFWIDAGLKTISASSLDGSSQVVVVKQQINEPYDIVVDPESGRIFWSDWIQQRIERVSMDGSDRTNLLHSACPTGLSVDFPARRLYFTDLKSHTIESVNLEGKERVVIHRFAIGEFKPYKLDVFEDLVYVTDYNGNKMFRLHKFGEGNATEVTAVVSKTSDVVVIHRSKHVPGVNVCRDKCLSTGLCLKNGTHSSICVCPNGKKFDSGSKISVVECNTTLNPVCDLKCKAGGECRIGKHGPECHCQPLYKGRLCDTYKCSGYCFNKGLCYPDPVAAMNGNEIPLKCQCPPKYTGKRCESKIEGCDGKCYNGGTCNKYLKTCECPVGFQGRLCEKCENYPCENGGVCHTNRNGKPFCECRNGFNGTNCSHDICDNFCKNNGVCRITNGTPSCECLNGFEGRQCEENMCHSFCRNGGSCVSTENKVTCKCPPGFYGITCENYVNITTTELPNLCENWHCEHGGTCKQVHQNVFCRCFDDYIGAHCEIEVQNSEENSCRHYCLNNGVCQLLDVNAKPQCKCLGFWTGPRCEIKATCDKALCLNGGTCNPSLEAGFAASCECPKGYHGIRCEHEDKPELWASSEESGLTWILILVFIIVAVGVAGVSGCIAYVVMRRKGRPFMHTRMQDSGTVEISNPMFMKDEGEEDHGSEPSLIFDSDKVLLQGTNFTNPVYETMYKEGETSASNDEKKGLLHDHPLADPPTC